MIQKKDTDNSLHELTEILNIGDRGLAYGDGLFETIAYVGGVLNNWGLHWQRLTMGAGRLAIELPEEQFFIKQIKLKISQDSHLDSSSLNDTSFKDTSLKDRVIKIIVTRGQGGRGYLYSEGQKSTIIISVHAWPERAMEDYQFGIRATICQTCLAKQPALAGIKHLNRLEQVLGRNEFSNSLYQEGIMLACSDNFSANTLNMDGFIIEGTSSNLFFVINDRLMTPKIDTCGVQGTIRQAVLLRAKKMAITVEESHFSLTELKNATEIFFTNSIFGILPVANITMNEQLQWQYNYPQDRSRGIASRLAKTINTAINRPGLD